MMKQNLSALVASRICHDLINPIGACSNGAELLALGGAGQEEMDLIRDSAENASLKVQFFRVAFGQAGSGQALSAAELQSLSQALITPKLKIDWRGEFDAPRKDARAVFLALLCLERALPRGGLITVKKNGSEYSLSAEADPLLVTEALWTPLSNGQPPAEVIPATVTFALLPDALKDLGLKLKIRLTNNRILMQF